MTNSSPACCPDAVGNFDYAYRYSTTNGRDWVYADLDGSPNGYDPVQAGKLTVNASDDSTASGCAYRSAREQRVSGRD